MRKHICDIFFSINNIRKTPIASAAFMISMCLIVFLCMGIASDTADLIRGKQQFNYLVNNNAWKLWSRVSDGRDAEMGENEQDTYDKYKKFYELLNKKNGCKSFTWCDLGAYEDSEYKSYIIAEKEFFQAYQLGFYRGKSDEWKDTGSIIPAVVGYNLRNIYKLDNEYEIEAVTGNNVKIKIIGILAQDAGVPSFVKIGRRTTLKNALIVPLQQSHIDDDDILPLLFNERIYYPKNKQEIYKLALKANEIGLYTMEPGSVKDEIHDYQEVLKKATASTIRIIIIASLFVIISIMISISTLLEERRMVFSIYILLGATKRRIVKQVAMQLLLLSLPSLLIASIIYGTGYQTIASVCVIIGICCLATLLGTRRFKQMDISTNLQRGDI